MSGRVEGMLTKRVRSMVGRLGYRNLIGGPSSMNQSNSLVLGMERQKMIFKVQRMNRRTFHTQTSLRESVDASPSTTSASSAVEMSKKKQKNSLVEDNETAFAETRTFNEQYPEVDEDEESNAKNEMPLKVAISQKASKQLNLLMTNDNNLNLALQVLVESGGCHGFQYNLRLIDLHKDKILKKDLNQGVQLEDLDPQADLLDDEVSIFVRDNAKVVLDKASLQILRESKIDYVKELIGSSFKVIDSPYTKSACGCGSSFDVDFSKL